MSARKSASSILISLMLLGCAPKPETPSEERNTDANPTSAQDVSKINNSSAELATPSVDAKDETVISATEEKAVAETDEKTTTSEQTEKEPQPPAVEPVPEVVAPKKNPKPLSFTEISERVDLRKIPIPEDGSFDRRTLSEAWMKLDRDVSATTDFVREHLLKQGCKEIDPVFDSVEPYVSLAFEANDVLVTAFLSPETEAIGGKPLTNFSLTVVGNLDARNLPALDETEAKDARQSNVQLVTSKPVQEAADAIIETFSNDGWVLFQDPTSLKNKPNADPQNLTFLQNGMILNAYASASAAFRSNGKTTILLSFKIVSSELPLPPESNDLTLDINASKLHCLSSSTQGDLVNFYKTHFESLGWQEMKGNRITDQSALLKYQRNNDITLIELTQTKKGVDVELVGLIDKHPDDEKRALAREEAKRLAVATNPIPFSIPEGAEQIKLSDDRTEVEYRILMSTQDLADFYRKAFTEIGWKEESRWTKIDLQNANMNFGDGDDDSTALNCLKLPNEKLTRVSAHATRCTWTLPERNTDSEKPEETKPTEPLEAEMHDELPIPADHSELSSSGSKFRKEIKAASPSEFARVHEFYLTQLADLGWEESRKGSEDELSFSREEDQLLVKLGRNEEETTIDMEIKFTGLAKKAGILPEPGTILVIVGNEAKDKAEFTVGEETITIEPGVGTQKPDGPRIELSPGKHKVRAKIGSIKHREKLNAEADQTWTIILHAGGPVLLRMY